MLPNEHAHFWFDCQFDVQFLIMKNFVYSVGMAHDNSMLYIHYHLGNTSSKESGVTASDPTVDGNCNYYES